MRCAQSGCEIDQAGMQAAGVIPTHCPTCGHPLIFVLSADELSALVDLPTEASIVAAESDATPQE